MAKKKAPVSKSVGASKEKHPVSTTSKPRTPKAGRAETSAKSASQTAEPIACEAIGNCAGAVWCCLSDGGPQSLAKLKKAVAAPPDLTLAAIGWLAREGKLHFETDGKQVTISLNGDG